MLWTLFLATAAVAAAPAAPPSRVALPADKHPLLSNPQVGLGGTKLYVARLDAPPGELTRGVRVSLVPNVPGGKAGQIDLPAPVLGDDVQLLVAPNEKALAVVTAGELWLASLDGEPNPRRLYPPAEGNAPIGPRLSRAAWSRTSEWLLVQTPLGWGQIAIATGEFAPLPLHPIDLTTGSLALAPDDGHVLLVKTQVGQGYVNGGPVLAVSTQSATAQVLDREHNYVGVLFLPDGKPLGVDSAGALWLLQATKRQPYFTPPPLEDGAIGGYAVDVGFNELAWTVLHGGKRADLWTVRAPRPPKEPTP